MDTREIDPRELVDFIDGPSSQDQTWNWLKDNGYVTNGRGLTVRLTKKGETALNRACAR
jgi:Mn-dependent DtxR family transcriptional regulator